MAMQHEDHTHHRLDVGANVPYKLHLAMLRIVEHLEVAVYTQSIEFLLILTKKENQ